MYFFRTFKKSTAPYKVHNMGLRYIKYLIDPVMKMLGKYLGQGRKVYLIVPVGK